MRRGRQTPTFERVGICDHSDGPDAVALFEGYGVRFIPAQEYEMELYLAKNELGECEAITIGLSRPRQNGKSFAARYRCIRRVARVVRAPVRCERVHGSRRVRGGRISPEAVQRVRQRQVAARDGAAFRARVAA